MSDNLAENIAQKALRVSWWDTVTAARRVAEYAAELIKELEADNKALRRHPRRTERTEMMMNEIKVTDIEEHEDGSATLQVECDPETFMAIFDVGFVTLVKRGLENEKWQTCVSCGGPALSDMCGFCLKEE